MRAGTSTAMASARRHERAARHQVGGGVAREAVILDALERSRGNRSKAAEELGIYRRLLYAKMREYGLGE